MTVSEPGTFVLVIDAISDVPKPRVTVTVTSEVPHGGAKPLLSCPADQLVSRHHILWHGGL